MSSSVVGYKNSAAEPVTGASAEQPRHEQTVKLSDFHYVVLRLTNPGMRVPGAGNQGVRLQRTLLNFKALQRSFTMKKFMRVLKDKVTKEMLSGFFNSPTF